MFSGLKDASHLVSYGFYRAVVQDARNLAIVFVYRLPFIAPADQGARKFQIPVSGNVIAQSNKTMNGERRTVNGHRAPTGRFSAA
jgi:hypothetical protein